jgi:hypothetical protein
VFETWLVQVCMRNVRFYRTVVRADCGAAHTRLTLTKRFKNLKVDLTVE